MEKERYICSICYDDHEGECEIKDPKWAIKHREKELAKEKSNGNRLAKALEFTRDQVAKLSPMTDTTKAASALTAHNKLRGGK